MLWVDQNQKVFWVVLLAVLSFTFAFPQVGSIFAPSASSQVVQEVFGKPFSRADYEQTRNQLVAIQHVAPNAFVSEVEPRTSSLTLPLESTRQGPSLGINAIDFHIYLEEAKRLGLRVSDYELGEVRRDAWRQRVAMTKAIEEIQRSPSPDNRQQRFMLQMKAQEIYSKLQEAGAFDPADWANMVRNPPPRVPAYRPAAFDEALRDVLLVRKLDAYLKSSVAVTEKAIFDRFNEQRERRKASWISLEPGEELRDKVAAGVTDQEVEEFFRTNRRDFRRSTTVRCEYLVIPREHFVKEIEASLTDQDIRKDYDSNRAKYTRPVLLADASAFQLLSQEEMAARDETLFRPFEEVEDEVRQDLVERRATEEARRLSIRLKSRLFPPEDATTQPVPTFEDLVGEFPFLVSGTVAPVSREDAEDAFGKGWVESTVTSWFRSADRAPDYDLTEGQRTALRNFQYLPDDAGYVFYKDVELIRPHDATIDEARDEVRETLVRLGVLSALSAAAEKRIEGLEAGSDLDVLVGQELEVELESGDTAKARFASAVETSVDFAGNERYGPRIRVRVPPAEDGEDADDGEDDEDPEETFESPSYEREIRKALFTIDDVGQFAVAEDEAEGACLVVRCDARVSPDPGDFRVYRNQFERELVEEAQQEFFADWKLDLDRRALPSRANAPAPDAEGEQLPGEDGGEGGSGSEPAAG